MQLKVRTNFGHEFQIPEDSVLESVEAMKWVLLYLSNGHDRCHREHLAQGG
jgi:hypothetical protein